jgi:Uma2 family endonuclease
MMLRKAKTEPRCMRLFDVPRDAGDEIVAAFGLNCVRYNPDSEMLALPCTMRGVTWEQYEALLEALPDHRLRHTYDRGFLEIMSPSQKHDKLKKIIGRFVEHMALTLGIHIECSGSATYRRKLLDRGLEPDETYFIANEPAVRGKLDWDPDSDPPPDLAVEMDLRRPSLRRMSIYAALGVPELWTHNGSAMRFHVLDPERRYREVDRSLSFPFLSPTDIDRFLSRLSHEPTDDIIVAFAKWAKAAHKNLAARKPRKKRAL